MSPRRPWPPPLGRGYVDFVETGDGSPGFGLLRLGGWLFAPGADLDEHRLLLDGRVAAEAEPLDRADVAAAFPMQSGARRSGFEFSTVLETAFWARGIDLEILGASNGEIIGRIRLRYREGFHAGLPVPPAVLRRRVTNSEVLQGYWLGGSQTADEFVAAIHDHYDDLGRVDRLLDWGCGCGRVTGFLQRMLQATEIHGCDVDHEAITWCREHLEGRFVPIDPFPPTEYPSGSFNVIVSYSVLTHLDRHNQTLWLQEVRRLLAPGGLLLATVHGDFATSFAADPRIHGALAADGIADADYDGNLKGVLPDGYYRTTYQTRDYTVAEFSRHFDVLEYRPQQMTNFQDLVIARRR